jgi:splicing factor U2AF subunit
MQGMLEDLTEECKKHGNIVDIRVPRPDAGIAAEAVLGKGCYGKVYVLMEDAESAVRLKEAVDGRMYDGRNLSALFIQQNHFYQLPISVGR